MIDELILHKPESTKHKIQLAEYEKADSVRVFKKSFFTDSQREKSSKPNVNKFYHSVNDEEFLLEYDEDNVYLSHEKWSLMVSGENLIEAELNLMREIKDLSKSFLKFPLNKLDDSAHELRSFILRNI